MCQLGMQTMDQLGLWILGDPFLRKYYSNFDPVKNRVSCSCNSTVTHAPLLVLVFKFTFKLMERVGRRIFRGDSLVIPHTFYNSHILRPSGLTFSSSHVCMEKTQVSRDFAQNCTTSSDIRDEHGSAESAERERE